MKEVCKSRRIINPILCIYDSVPSRKEEKSNEKLEVPVTQSTKGIGGKGVERSKFRISRTMVALALRVL